MLRFPHSSTSRWLKTSALLGVFLLFISCKSHETLGTPELGQNSISSLERVQIGGVNQWILMRGDDRAKPVLLILHGGPGAASIGFARTFYSDLEKNYVVVNWDQRGAGKSFALSMGDVSPETYVSDTLEVITFLKIKFKVPKIYLMGHSWGGYIGAIAAHKHPENLHAFIAIGPVISGEESAKLSFAYIQQQASKDAELKKEAESLTLDSYLQNRRKWLNAFAAGMFHGAHSKDEDSYLRGIMSDSPDYSLMDMITYLPGIWRTSSRIRPYFFKMNLFEEASSIDVPVFLLSGRFDYYNPVEILERYATTLKSPSTKVILFDNLAHAPHFESPAEFAESLHAALSASGH